MRKVYVFIILLTCIYRASNLIPRERLHFLYDSKWNYCHDSECKYMDHLIFYSDDTYEEYTAQHGNTYYGSFVVSGDTVVVNADSAKYKHHF